jgi:hypothetical protein
VLPDLLYLVDYSKAPGLLDSEVMSFEYIVPRPRIELPLGQIAGCRTFIAVRRGETATLAVVGVASGIAELDDETQSTNPDLLLELDRYRSFRVSSPGGQLDRVSITTGDFPIGTLGECPPELSAQWRQELTDRFVTTISEPGSRFTSRRWKLTDGAAPVRDQVARLTSTTALDRLSTSRALQPLSPFGAELYRSFDVTDLVTAAELRQLTDQLDPFRTLIQSSLPIEAIGVSTSFDSYLRPLDPAKIKTRKYVARSPFVDLSASLALTERAEKFHQNIVKRLALGLIEIGISPFFSDSVDLAFDFEEKPFIVEVKTVNEYNLASQVLRGVSQLLYYLAGLDLAGRPSIGGQLVIACAEALVIPRSLTATVERAHLSFDVIVTSTSASSPLFIEARRLESRAQSTAST